MVVSVCRWNQHNMAQPAELTPLDGEEVFAASSDNKHNKTHVSANVSVQYQRMAIQLMAGYSASTKLFPNVDTSLCNHWILLYTVDRPLQIRIAWDQHLFRLVKVSD